MTREKIHSSLNSDGNLVVASVIDAVIDLKEYETCSNCKHEDTISCPAYDYESGLSPTASDFGCNKWEEK